MDVSGAKSGRVTKKLRTAAAKTDSAPLTEAGPVGAVTGTGVTARSTGAPDVPATSRTICRGDVDVVRRRSTNVADLRTSRRPRVRLGRHGKRGTPRAGRADRRGDDKNRHRALTSLVEELEAVDWYDTGPVQATNDASLADVLAHNRDEEKEHASMTLEWLRRRDPVLDRHLRTYLFTSEPVTEVEAEAAAGGEAAAAASGSLGLGSLKGTE